MTGDETLDIVTVSAFASFGGISERGGLAVWEGGPGLRGPAVKPDAILISSNASSANHRLGGPGHAPVQFADLSGDGVEDIVVAASGEVAVWYAGDLTGLPEPSLAFVGSGTYRSLRLSDVSGDGLKDVVVDAGDAVLIGLADPLRSGNQTPDVVLPAIDGIRSDGEPLWLRDLDRDGINDLTACSFSRVHFWSGGTGLPGASAELKASYPAVLGRLGSGTGVTGSGIRIVELDGDRKLDVIASDTYADANNVRQSGALFFWSAAGDIDGVALEDVQLSVPNARKRDLLGH